MSTLSRRTALSVLGLAPATMIGTEDASQICARTTSGHKFNYSIDNGKRIGVALRALADDIDARGTYIQEFALNSKANLDNFIEHELVIKFQLASQAPKS